MTDDKHNVVVKQRFLKAFARNLERPMLFLSFVWFVVIVTELVNGISPFLLIFGTILWALLFFISS